MTITLYRLEYLSISLMALLTLFSFHFGLSLGGQIECSVVMGLMASPSCFLPFSRFLTSSLLQSQFSTWLSQTLLNSHSLTFLFGILLHSSTILKLILQIKKLSKIPSQSEAQT